MYRNLIYLVLVFLIACSGGKNNGKDTAKSANQLIEKGFLKYTDAKLGDSLENRLKESFDIYDSAMFRAVHIDAEELAQFSFDFFEHDLRAVLGKRGLPFATGKVNAGEKDYTVMINTLRFPMYTEIDLLKPKFWEIASRNYFRNLNQFMKMTGSDEQFYLLYGGNDLEAILLTKPQFDIIADYYKDEAKEKPYAP